MEIKIEKGVPLDAISCSRNRHPILEALLSMEIGESFFVFGPRSLVQQRVVYAQKKTSKRYATRKHAGGYRVWRLA